jgi:hypothetical protein
VNRKVPRGAALLLDFIGDIEAPSGYGTLYRNCQHLLARPLVEMNLGEVLAAQPEWARQAGSSAAGRYQLIHATLAEMSGKLRLAPGRRFDPDLQDLLGYALLRRRGYARYAAGAMPRNDFALALAREWASIPVIEPVLGAHRPLVPGESYYAGDNRNHALIDVESLAGLLDRLPRD